MIKYIKENWKGVFVALFLFLGGAVGSQLEVITTYLTEEEIEGHEEAIQLEALKFFEERSRVIDHRIENGKIYLKYKTCWNGNPDTYGDYKYRVYVNGNPTGPILPEARDDWYNINDWYVPIYCTEGWWGQRGWQLPEQPADSYFLRVVWEFRILINDHDAPRHHIRMEYHTGHK